MEISLQIVVWLYYIITKSDEEDTIERSGPDKVRTGLLFLLCLSTRFTSALVRELRREDTGREMREENHSRFDQGVALFSQPAHLICNRL